MSLFRSVLLLVFTAVAAGPLGKVSPALANPAPSPSATRTPIPGPLLSPRALRRARLLIQMRMLQLRDERLDCVRAAILRRLPPDLRPTGSPAPALKQFGAAHATKVRGTLELESEGCEWISTRRERRSPTG
jgi:hypothetical protein